MIKNRRMVVVALLLVTVMCIGVGYAALYDTINFTGKISYTPAFDIVWDEVTSDPDNLLDGIEVEGADPLTVSMDTTNWVVDVPKSFTITVKNDSLYDAENVKCQALTTDDVEANYTVAVEVADDTITAGDTTTVTVTVTMESYPEDEIVEATFTFQIYADQATSTS